jgi:hypothetical protein
MKTTILSLACAICAAMSIEAGAQTTMPRVLGPNPLANPTERLLNSFPPFVHWDLREFPNCRVPWTTSPHAVPNLDGDAFANTPVDRVLALNEFVGAFASWEAVQPALIGFALSGTAPGPGGSALDGYNTIGWDEGARDDVQIVPPGTVIGAGALLVWAGPNNILESQPGGDDVIGGIYIFDGGNGIAESKANTWSVAGLLAVTGLFYNNKTGVIIEADIMFENAGTWVIGATPNDSFNFELNVRGVATHEIGHFMGIAHPIITLPLVDDAADGQTPTMAPVLFPMFDGNTFNQTLEDLDKDCCNFLYCPDLGDAPDPCVAGGTFNDFPSLVHKTGGGRTLNELVLDRVALGAEHLFGIKERQPNRNWTYEWLATAAASLGATTECEANITDKDPLDDGVRVWPNPPVWGRKMRVRQDIRYASDAVGFSHHYSGTPLYANGWLDVNQNCIWEEHFMSVPKRPASPTGFNTVLAITAFGAVDLPAIVNADFPGWLRCRLDYGENVGARAKIDPTLDNDKGAAQFGEVEDYPFYCTTRYEVQWLCNPYPFPVPGVAMVYVGPGNAEDVMVSLPVSGSDVPTGTNPPPITTYNAPKDESIVFCPAITLIPPFGYMRSGKCRPNPPHASRTHSLSSLPSDGPQTKLRSFFTTDGIPATTPAELVPLELRIPTVNCGTSYMPGVTSPGTVQFTVGVVDFENGGWIDGPDTLTGEWEDTLHVTVSYRVASQLIPVQNLSTSDPLYAALPLHFVGSGIVTPADGFVFTLNVPSDLPLGQYAILEVQSSWSTNSLVNHEIIEFPVPAGTSTGIDTPELPSALALDNYPNPFNPNTIVRYALPTPAKVRLDVFDVAGRLVRTLVRDARQPAGVFEVEWDGRDSRGMAAASGVYFFRLAAGVEALTRKAVLLK